MQQRQILEDLNRPPTLDASSMSTAATSDGGSESNEQNESSNSEDVDNTIRQKT